MQVVLVMFRSDGERRSFSVVRNMTLIGRREDCDLRIPVGDVSRKHCKLVLTDDGVRIEDLGSSNGTLVNGQRIQESDLSPGDIVGIGPVQFIVQINGVPDEDEMVPPGSRHQPDDDDSLLGHVQPETTADAGDEFSIDEDTPAKQPPAPEAEIEDHQAEHAAMDLDDGFSLEELPGSDATIDEDAPPAPPVPPLASAGLLHDDDKEPLEDFELADALEPLDLAPEHASALPAGDHAEETQPVDLDSDESQWDFVVEETDPAHSSHDLNAGVDSAHQQPHQ